MEHFRRYDKLDMRRLAAALLAGTIAGTASAQLPMHSPPLGTAGAGCNTTATTWNPADKDASITLTNSNLTANGTTGSWKSVRGTTHKATGKVYYEISFDGTAPGNVLIAGVGDATASLTTFVGADTHGYTCQTTGSLWYNTTNPGNCGWDGTTTSCKTLEVALDLGGNLGWWRGNCASLWNNTSGADPGTGVSGKALNIAGGSVQVYPAGSFITSNAAITLTLNTAGCGATPFVISSVPTGFSAWQ